MNFNVLSFEEHNFVRAYEILYGRLPGGDFMLLSRPDLDRRRRQQTRVAQVPGASIGLNQVEWAHASLCSLLGGQRSAMISGWSSELLEGVACSLKPGVVETRKAQRAAVEDAMRAPKDAELEPAPAEAVELSPEPSADVTETVDERPSSATLAALKARLKSHTMFGRYLLSEGHITLQQLIDAVRWQRAQRPPVGRIAVSWGILSTEQVFELLSKKEPDERFCDLAVSRGYMTRFQRLAVLGRQRQLQKPIGRYFVENGILSEERVAELVQTALSVG